MYRHDLHILAEQLVVNVLQCTDDRRRRNRSPSRICTESLKLGTCDFEQATHLLRKFFLGGIHGAAYQRPYCKMTVFCTHNSHIHRCLHQAVHRRTHSLHAARASINSLDSPQHDIIFYIRGIRLYLFFENALGSRISISELCLRQCEYTLNFSLYNLLIFSRNKH